MEFKLAFRLKKEQLKSRLGVIKLNELLNILMNSWPRNENVLIVPLQWMGDIRMKVQTAD